jgi:hypothetical protein
VVKLFPVIEQHILIPSADQIPEILGYESTLQTKENSPSQVLADTERMSREMSLFADYANGGILDTLVATFPRNPTNTFNQYSFRLHPIEKKAGSYSNVPEYQGKVWPDGPFGFAISYKNSRAESGRLLAYVGFTGTDSLPGYKYYGRQPVSKEDIPEDFPDALVVVQLQGIKYRDNERKDEVTTKIIQGFQWEHVLVTLAEAFSSQLNIYDVALLAARKNLWYPTPDNNRPDGAQVRGRFALRYNLTAENLDYKTDKAFAHTKQLA